MIPPLLATTPEECGAQLRASLAFEAVVDAVIEFDIVRGRRTAPPSPAERAAYRAQALRLLNTTPPDSK